MTETDETNEKGKQTKTILTVEQRYAIASWLIMNGLLVQDNNKKVPNFTYFVGKRTEIHKRMMKEIPDLPSKTTVSGMISAVDYFNRVKETFGIPIIMPAAQMATVEHEQLVARIKTLETQNEKFVKLIDDKNKEISDTNTKARKSFEEYIQILREIAQLIPAGILNTSKK